MAFFNRLLKQTDLLIGVGLVLIVGMLIIPLPDWVLDMGLVAAIGASVVILISAVNVQDPLEFSVFPSLLLITTLFRLALSVAATKLILGTGQAGEVIATFGSVVMGGDAVVGFVAFLILIVVQFIVITNGAGRVAEVVARFTLDAMPGKQMAIDADLAAGLINEDQARKRRKKIKQEADFYGSMDGASKFVKGDAIASIMIIAINIVGGFAVGFIHGGSDPATILKTYSLLSVGEGLVSQIPALMISTASGLMVTRAGQDRSMGREVASQILNQPKAIGFASAALAGLAFVPGFPTVIFLGAAAIWFFLFRFLKKTPDAAKIAAGEGPKEDAPAAAPKPVPTGPEAVMPLLAVDALEIEVGYALTKLADPRQGGDLPDRITATRRQIALELGFVMPSVRIRDSVGLNSHDYVIKVRGEEVAHSSCRPDSLLAVSSGSPVNTIPGLPTKDPVFGLDALWIEPSLKDAAERAGFTVIEPSAVVSTHLAEIVKQHAHEVLSRQDVSSLIDNARNVNRAVVEELYPNVLQLGEIQKVLQHLLKERVPIRDLVSILETMADYAGRIKDPDQLGEIVRSSMARTITRQHVDDSNRLHCITFDGQMEKSLADKVQLTSAGTMVMLDPGDLERLTRLVRAEVDSANAKGAHPVLLCGTVLRLPLHRLLEKQFPNLSVIAYNEVASQADVEFVGQVRAA